MLVRQGLSLKTQLYLSIWLIVTLCFGVVSFLYIEQQRSFLIENQSAQVNNTGRLAKSLLQSQASLDQLQVILGEQLNFFIDRIELANGDETIALVGEPYVANIWDTFWQLPSPEYRAAVPVQSGNWQITVTGGTVVASAQLTELLITTMQIYLLCLLIALLAFALIAHAMLSPLRSVIAMANAIVGKRFQRFEFRSFTKEFSLLQKALNHMIDAITRTINEQSDFAEQLQNSLFIDDLTRLKNRKAFDASFQNFHEHYTSHWILLIRADGLEKVNHELGHREGDELLVEVAQCLQHYFDGVSVFRLSGAEFAVAIDNIELIDEDSIDLLTQQLQNISGAQPVTFIMAAARCEPSMASKNILMALDARLMERRVSPHAPLMIEGRLPIYENYSSWKEVIEDLISTKSVSLDVQYAAELSDSGTTYAEIFARFNLSQHVDVAALFSLADRYDLSEQLDRAVVERALLSELTLATAFGINISARTLLSDSFVAWLAGFAEQLAEREIVLEIGEEVIVRHPQKARQFVEQVSSLGVSVAIDRFGSSMQSLRYWQNLNVSYVKMDAGYIEEVVKHDDQAVLLRYIVSMAHNAGMKVMVSQLQNQALVPICRELSVDMIQGRAVVPPAPYIV
ncbi:EAL domain-containing protein [Salinibius halmophilus]|uniref:EAL domain-containing protein n=1 Tax=Salinibius halmophilus TaxID=1853216 RepID=UPI000E65EE7D|nr:GGDEF domain-containing protein [Salinibius halmophilus]